MPDVAAYLPINFEGFYKGPGKGDGRTVKERTTACLYLIGGGVTLVESGSDNIVGLHSYR